MIVTTASFGSHQLTLIAHVDEHGQPMLVEANWLLSGNSWHSSKSVPKLKKYYGLTDKDFTFIDKNGLSMDEPAQALLIETIFQLKDYADGKRKTLDLPLVFLWVLSFSKEYGRHCEVLSMVKLSAMPHSRSVSTVQKGFVRSHRPMAKILLALSCLVIE